MPESAPTTRCFACHTELAPEDDHADPAEALRREQWDNALVLRLEGGYGMFIDPIPTDPATDRRSGVLGPADRGAPADGLLERTGALKVVICHGCAHELCERVPWVDRLIEPSHSHAHRVDRDWSGHTGWDLPHRCDACGSDTVWDDDLRLKVCPDCG